MSNVQARNVLLEPWASIQFKGKVLPEKMMKYVRDIVVEDEEDKLPLARIYVNDSAKIWLNDKSVVKNTKVVIKLGHRLNNRKMFDGIITQVEVDFPQTGDPVVVVSMLDVAQRLLKEREARNFKNVKVSDVVLLMFKEAGIKGEVVDTKAKLEHVPQEKESNLEFISRWRKKLGWKFYKKSNGTYYFGPKKRNGKVKTLGYKTGGMEIISFTPIIVELETDETKAKESEIDNKGGVRTYTIKNVKAVLVPNNNSSTSKPIGKA